METTPKISIIVPVFNEEKTVAGVLTSLLGFDSVAEVICVDDGSTDRSGEIIQSFKDRIKTINLPQNRGKGFALVAGLREAHGEVVVFLDSDLFDLTEKHLQRLVSPLLEKRAEATLGAIHNPKLRSFLLPFVGQRAYWRKDLLPHLNNMAETRYGVEVYLNEAFKKKRVEVVWLKGLGHVIKHKKRGFSETSKEYFIEWLEVSRTLLRNSEKKLGKKMPILNHPGISKLNFTKLKTTRDLIKALARVTDREVLDALKKYFSSWGQRFKG